MFVQRQSHLGKCALQQGEVAADSGSAVLGTKLPSESPGNDPVCSQIWVPLTIRWIIRGRDWLRCSPLSDRVRERHFTRRRGLSPSHPGDNRSSKPPRALLVAPDFPCWAKVSGR